MRVCGKEARAAFASAGAALPVAVPATAAAAARPASALCAGHVARLTPPLQPLGRIQIGHGGRGRSALKPALVAVPARPRTLRMGPAQKGLFTPLVVAVRNVIGKRRFEKVRGKGIALHSQAIADFCKFAGADAKMRQALIRTAKATGAKLGFLS